MATKRVLYKPVQANVGKKRNRRPLAQGRLVTAAAHPVSSATRLQQGVVSDGEDQGMAVMAGSREDPSATPRRAVPRVSQQQSPVATPPVHTLDLSDSEDDQPQSHFTLPTEGVRPGQPSPGRQTAVHTVPHVMVLDASMVTGSPHHAHEECVVGYERSPATVICHAHSPPSDPLSAREQAVWKVAVDPVRKAESTSPPPAPHTSAISPLSGAPRGRPSDHRSHHTGSREADSSPEPRTDGKGVRMGSRSSPAKVSSLRKKQGMRRLAQPSFDDSGESGDVANQPAGGAPSEVTSDSETCSLFEYVPQNKSRAQTAEGSIKPPPKSTKKKKGERTVASRYMQSTKSKKVTSSSSTASTGKGVQAKRNLSHSLFTNTNNSGSQVSGRRPANTSRCTPHLSTGSSPERSQGDGGSRGKTSTPTHDGVPIMTSCDASAINPELSMLSAMEASHLRVGIGSGSGPTSAHNAPPKHKKVDLRQQQQRLDLSYARYLQWLFLDSKASLTLQQQEKDAMRQLQGVWEMVEKKRQEKGELEREVARLKHLNLLDTQLHSQQQSLEPVVRLLPMLQRDYSGLAQAVDTTRHQIATHGVHLPDNELLYLESLERVLMESEQLLGTLSTLTRRQAPGIQDFAHACQALHTALQQHWGELHRCEELLSAMQSLATHENSLRIQAMQGDR